ncbi:MAG: hypothetical protein E7329_03565 [Clostridiales bacterium]|nr:hypothetical protein [Clostridiales bacterium]
MTAIADVSNNSWELKHYVDEFNDPTDAWYVRTTTTGAFSNTATANSEVTAVLVIDEQNIAIMLYEYGHYPVTNTSSKMLEYSVRIKDGNDETHTFDGYLTAGGDRIILWSDESFGPYDSTRSLYSEIINILSAGGNVRFSISEDGNAVTKYTFRVDANGFKDVYSVDSEGLFGFFNLNRANFIKEYQSQTGLSLLFVDKGYKFVSSDCGYAGEPTARVSFYFGENGLMHRYDVNFNHSDGGCYNRVRTELTNMYGTPVYTKVSKSICEFPSETGDYYNHKERYENGWVTQEYSDDYKLYGWYGDYCQWVVWQNDGSAILVTLYLEHGGLTVGKNEFTDAYAAVICEYYPAELVSNLRK